MRLAGVTMAEGNIYLLAFILTGILHEKKGILD